MTNSVPTANHHGPGSRRYLLLEQRGQRPALARPIWPFSSNTIALSRNSPAQPLRFIRVAFHGRCPAGVTCAYPEVFTVEIPEVELRQAAPECYRFKVFARLCPDAEVIIPKVQIAAPLARIDADRLPGAKPAAQRPN